MPCANSCGDSEIKYKGNGSQVQYTFPFEYMAQSDVKVDIYNESTRRWVDADDSSWLGEYAWSFANATTIEFENAPPAPLDEDTDFNIKIYRCTDIDPLIAQFNPGSAIRARDLNDNFEQLKLAIEEGRCQIPEWLFDYLDKYYWNKAEETTYIDDVWVDESDDEHVPTTGAVQQELVERWDKRTETTYIPDNWEDEADDDHVPTTGAVDKHIDEEIQLNYDVRSVTRPEQISNGGLGKIEDVFYFTTAASAQRHDVYHQDPKPTDLPYEQPGKMWFDTATLDDYTWDANAGAWVDMQNSGPPGPAGPPGPPGSTYTFTAPLKETDGVVSIDLQIINSTP
mgnify:FL=1